MDATEVFDGPYGTFRFQDYKCKSKASIHDALDGDIAGAFASLGSKQTPKWAVAHEITSYLRAMRYSIAHRTSLWQDTEGHDHVTLVNTTSRFDWATTLRLVSSEF